MKNINMKTLDALIRRVEEGALLSNSLSEEEYQMIEEGLKEMRFMYGFDAMIKRIKEGK
jgi:hypothetical protein